MRSIVRSLVIGSLVSASASAQGPVAPMSDAPQGRAFMGPPAASMLLARTGELGLTDVQVVRLAAIARRAETRRAALRASMDSARQRFLPGQPGDSVARRQFRERMQADRLTAQDAARVDLRDAIALLNADQQAKAWEMVASRGRAARAGAMRGNRGREMRMRPGQGRRPGNPGFRERRPMDDRRQLRPGRVPADSESERHRAPD